MHELSIVANIIQIATEIAESQKAKNIDKIELEIGTLAGVEMSAFDFAWEATVENTVLAHSERRIHRMNGRAQCLVCNNEFDIAQYFDPCPNCGSFKKEILSGNELKVKRITLS